MPSETDLWRALVPVLDALTGLGVEHHVGGSVASSMSGVSRATQDVDVVAELRPAHAEPLVAALGEAYYADAGAVREAAVRRGSVNVLHLPTMFKVDLFVPKGTPLDHAARGRKVWIDVPGAGRPLPFASPEDIVLQKLAWYLAGGEVSERQWHDVLGVLRLQGTRIDTEYLRRWSGDLGVAVLIARVLREAGLP